MTRTALLAVSGLLALCATVVQAAGIERGKGEIDALPIRGYRPIPYGLALEAAETAIQTCSRNKRAIVVQVYNPSGELRVMLNSDGPIMYDAEVNARQNAANARETGMPSGGAIPMMRDQTPKGVISVAGAVGISGDEENPDQDIACAQAGADKIKNRL
jgi:uncharacterized protein GlcG (DUF336 family)